MSAAVQASPLNRLAANLEELGLEGMASSVPEYVRLVADGRKSLVDAMLELTDAQIALKRRADDERRTRMANFPYIKTLADFDWGFQPSVPRGLVEQHDVLVLVDDLEPRRRDREVDVFLARRLEKLIVDVAL